MTVAGRKRRRVERRKREGEREHWTRRWRLRGWRLHCWRLEAVWVCAHVHVCAQNKRRGGIATQVHTAVAAAKTKRNSIYHR